MIPKVVDKITLDSWFMNSESLGYLLQIMEQRFPYRGKKVEKMDYLHIANVAQQTAVELVMNLSYGDLLQLLCENPWMLNTEAELDLLEIFEEKKSTKHSLKINIKQFENIDSFFNEIF